MWEKIKKIIRDFWWVIFLPLLAFIIARQTRRPVSEVLKEIKEQKKEIKDTEKKIDKQEDVVKEEEKKLNGTIKDIEDVLDKNLENKEKRDEEAKKFFPDL